MLQNPGSTKKPSYRYDIQLHHDERDKKREQEKNRNRKPCSIIQTTPCWFMHQRQVEQVQAILRYTSCCVAPLPRPNVDYTGQCRCRQPRRRIVSLLLPWMLVYFVQHGYIYTANESVASSYARPVRKGCGSEVTDSKCRNNPVCRAALQTTLNARKVIVRGPVRVWPHNADGFPNVATSTTC